MVIGNERCFYLFMDCNSGLRQVYFAGDIASFKPGDARHYFVSGGQTQNVAMSSVISNTLITGSGINNYASSHIAGYFAGDAISGVASVKGTSQEASQMASGGGLCFGSRFNSNRPYPGPVSGGLDLARIMIYEANYMERGEWPGVFQPLHGMPLEDQALHPASSPDLADLLVVSYRRRQTTSDDGSDDGQVLFEMGVEW